MTIAEFVTEHQITSEYTRIPARTDRCATDWDKNARHWLVSLVFGAMRPALRFGPINFSQGSAHKKPPTAVDVLQCLILDAGLGDNTFDDFCAGLGEDTDSRKALESYLTCQKTRTDLRTWAGRHFTALMEATED